MNHLTGNTMRNHHPAFILFKAAFLILSALLLSGCAMKKEVVLTGKTMGTTYHITLVAGYFSDLSNLQQKIDRQLEAINQSMSTYRKTSEISRFNALRVAGEKFAVSEDFWQVMSVARKIFDLTGGAWDGTVGPLVKLWGFGGKNTRYRFPQEAEIQALRAGVGFDQIDISPDRCLIKRKADLFVDLASIAKGYGVDRVAAVILENGFENFLVEIGGEVFASGTRKDGKRWRVGINRPQKDAAFDTVYKVVSLKNKAFATSGDYRNFFEIDGRRYSHVLDPRSGHPVSNGVVSVSIVADTCTFADGLATAVMVMGHFKGLELVEKIKGVECLIVVEQPDGRLLDHFSSGFRQQN